MSKKKAGRPSYTPTDKDHAFVRAMVMMGAGQDRIARVLDIDEKTLRKHFRETLDIGADVANANVVANLYRQATRNDFKAATSAIYWTKARMGWSDRQTIQHAGPTGGPVEIDLTKFSAEQLAALEPVLAMLAMMTPQPKPDGE